jgi:glycosyltransferase involved in cell wall biosynthesis
MPGKIVDDLDSSRVVAVIPCHDEAHTVARVIEGFSASLPDARVIVVDNGSTDETADAARAAGAEVLAVPALGKGNAVRAAVAGLTAAVIVLIDGDATYDSAQAAAVVRPVVSGDADMAIGDRLTHPSSHAFLPFRHSANAIITFAVDAILGTHCGDVLSGYRALSGELLERMELHAEGFEIETELLCEARRLGARVVDVPIGYEKRHSESRSKLVPVGDAIRILWTAWRLRPGSREHLAREDRPAADGGVRHEHS